MLCNYYRYDDLKQMLDSNKDGLKLEAMKRIIGVSCSHSPILTYNNKFILRFFKFLFTYMLVLVCLSNGCCIVVHIHLTDGCCVDVHVDLTGGCCIDVHVHLTDGWCIDANVCNKF